MSQPKKIVIMMIEIRVRVLELILGNTIWGLIHWVLGLRIGFGDCELEFEIWI